MSNYSKGEWKVCGESIEVDGEQVAYMADWEPEYRQEQEANARLLAAAAPLLEALITLSAEECRDDDDPVLIRAREQARAAIAKAGG